MSQNGNHSIFSMQGELNKSTGTTHGDNGNQDESILLIVDVSVEMANSGHGGIFLAEVFFFSICTK